MVMTAAIVAWDTAIAEMASTARGRARTVRSESPKGIAGSR